MASGIINGTTSNSNIDSKIEWSSTPSTANNSSVVTASLYYKRTNTYSGTQTGGKGTFSITIDGQTGNGSASITIPNSKEWVLALTVTKTVAHNTDGNKTITISATGSISGTTVTSTDCSGTATLDRISRGATIVSAPNFTDEENPTIMYANAGSFFVTSLQACISIGGTTPTVPYRDIPMDGLTYQFKLTDDERTALRNATKTDNTAFAYFIIKSVVGGVEYTSKMIRVLTIVNADPVFNDSQVDYADSNTAVVAVTGNPKHIVQTHSLLDVTYGAAVGVKGAEIDRYIIEVNGLTLTTRMTGTLELGAVNSSTDVTLSVTVIDSRGNSKTVNKTVTVLPWSAPVLTASVGRETTFDDEVDIKAEATISSVNEKNQATVTYQYKTIDGEYGNEVQIPNGVKYGVVCDPSYAYTFRIAVTDSFGGSAFKEYSVEKGILPLFIDTKKNAVSINTFPDSGEAFRVAGGLAVFDDGIVLKTATKAFKITINDSGSLVIKEMK